MPQNHLSDHASHPGPERHHAAQTHRFLPLAIGSIGVVFGDIGTSPLYAFREALLAAVGGHHAGASGTIPVIPRESVLGVLSLIVWALVLVVTAKYVLILLRADNNGEGGTLSLMALCQRALGRGKNFVFFLGVIGEYVLAIFNQVRRKPLVVERERINFE